MSKNNSLKFGIWVSLGGLALNVLKQSIEIDEGTKEKFSWGEFFKWGAGSFCIGFGVGFVLDHIEGAETDQPRMRETSYLRSVLRSYDPKETLEFEFQKRKANEIRDAIEEEFQEQVFRPQVSGSMGRGTGIAGSSDYDLVVPYAKYAFKTLEEMSETTYRLLEEYAQGDSEITDLRRQGVSIGVGIKYKGIETRIDIVPGKEQSNYSKDKNLSLHVRAKDWFSEPTYIKTNISKHKELMKGNTSQKQVTRLLKVWRDRKDVDVKGFELELLVDKAFKYNIGCMPSSLFGKLIMAAGFIHEQIDTISLADPGAPSKRVFEDSDRRYALKRKIGTMLKEILEDRQKLRDYFPENPI